MKWIKMRIILLLLIIVILVVIQAKCRESFTERLTNKSNGSPQMISARLPITVLDGLESSDVATKTSAIPSTMLFLNYWNGCMSNTSADPATPFKPNIY